MNAPTDTDQTRDELYERAQELDIEGRSGMNRDELAAAVAKAEGGSAPERSPRRPEVGSPLSTGPVPSSFPGAIQAPQDAPSKGVARSASRKGERIKRQRELAGRDPETGART